MDSEHKFFIAIVVPLIIGLATIVTIFCVSHLKEVKKQSDARIEIHRMWTDALTRSVETICDRFLVLNLDGENMVIEVQK